MPHIAETKIVIVWEHDLVTAAKMLHVLKTNKPKPTSQDYLNAIRACDAAIYSPELASGKCPVTIMSALRLEPKGKE